MAKEPVLKRLNRLRQFAAGGDVESYLTAELRQNFKAIEDTFGVLLDRTEPVFYEESLPDAAVVDADIPVLPLIAPVFQSAEIPVVPDKEYIVFFQPDLLIRDSWPALGFTSGSRTGSLFVSNGFDEVQMSLLESSSANAYSVNRAFLMKGNPSATKMRVTLSIGRFSGGSASDFTIQNVKMIVTEI